MVKELQFICPADGIWLKDAVLELANLRDPVHESMHMEEVHLQMLHLRNGRDCLNKQKALRTHEGRRQER
jgi:hypothetical protein